MLHGRRFVALVCLCALICSRPSSAQPSAEQRSAGLLLFRRSVLERIYPETKPADAELTGGIHLQATLGEYEPVQIGVLSLRDLDGLQVLAGDLTDGAGHVLPAAAIDVRLERYYNQPVAITETKRWAVVPKTLEPMQAIDLDRGQVRPYWITVHVPDEQAAGEYRGVLRFVHADGERSLPFAVEVVPVHLEDPDLLYAPICMSVLANLWKTLPAGPGTPEKADALLGKAQRNEEMLGNADLVFADLRRHGMTGVSLRSGSAYRERDGHPYLPELEAAIAAYHRYGFTQPLVYCLGYLLSTNKITRSSNYRSFDPAVHPAMAHKVAAYYTRRFRDEGLPGILFMPVEEPNPRSGVSRWDDPLVRSKLARQLNEIIRESGGRTAMTCTPESVTPVAPLLDHWIAGYKKFNSSLYQRAADAHAHLDLYANAALMGQNPYFSRFFFGYFIWANRFGGMLPWTYPLSPKRFPVNAKHRGEGGLDVRDGFLGRDGKPIPTIQWEMAREGIDDVKTIVAVERLSAAARARGKREATALADEADQFVAGLRASIGRDAWHYDFEDQNYAPQAQDGWDAARFADIRARAFELLKRLRPYEPV